MSDYDWNLSAGAPLCVFSDSFYYSARDAVFRQLSKESTDEQYAAALESLTRLRDELVQNLYPMHYGSLVGRHRCVDHVFREARARLHGLQVTKPAPVPPPALPQKPQPVPLEALLANVERIIAENAKETPFGHDREEEADGTE
jgi:hypothetical protein